VEEHRLKFGLQLFTDYNGDRSTIWRQVREQVDAAESSLFDGVFVPTDVSWRRLDALSLLAALASMTERVTVGTNVITLPLYSPVHVGEAIATSDIISGGRTVLGVAAGWREDEFRAAGVPFKQRVGRLYESIRIIKALWTDASVDHDGKYFQLDKIALELKPVQRPHPPIWIGAHAQSAIERAARAGLVWVEGPRTSLATYLGKLDGYQQTLADTGQSIHERPLIRDAFVAETTAEARAGIEASLIAKYGEYARQANLEIGRGGVSFDKLARGRFVVGSVDECTTAVKEYADAGVNWLILRMQYPNSDPVRVLEAIELFGREVAPKFRADPGGS
jgi:alkanesulfonate monooxygenase SsuD/methylene tetrahydromethanopterin reductase-like flavin-dependent oxidoreductase (luciferase family)